MNTNTTRRRLGSGAWRAVVLAVAVTAACGAEAPGVDTGAAAGTLATVATTASAVTRGSVGSAPGATTPYHGAKQVDVYVVDGPIAAGEPAAAAIARGAIRREQIAQQFRPSTAINTLEEIEQKEAWFDLAPGTLVVQGMFVVDDGTLPSVPLAPAPTIAPAAPTPSPDGTVLVLMAAGSISRGATGRAAVAAKDIMEVRVPAHVRPDTAYVGTEGFADLVARFEIAPGTVICDGMFVPPA